MDSLLLRPALRFRGQLQGLQVAVAALSRVGDVIRVEATGDLPL